VPVNCINCTHYEPDKINPSGGLGQCRTYAAGIASTSDDNAIRKARLARGNFADYPLFWPGLRDCKLFKRVLSGKPPTTEL
jgi:hypothetical protein